MSVSRSLNVQRQTLGAGTKTPIVPAGYATGCTVLNATPDDLELHTTDDDDAHFLIIAAGFERTLPKLHENGTTYSEKHTAFWLRAVQGGTVILIWT